ALLLLRHGLSSARPEYPVRAGCRGCLPPGPRGFVSSSARARGDPSPGRPSFFRPYRPFRPLSGFAAPTRRLAGGLVPVVGRGRWWGRGSDLADAGHVRVSLATPPTGKPRGGPVQGL